MNGRWFARVLLAASVWELTGGASAQPPPTEPLDNRHLKPEERAYYEAQRETLVAYIECLKGRYLAERSMTSADAAAACGAERAAYSAYLPEDLVALELDVLDYRIARDFRRE